MKPMGWWRVFLDSLDTPGGHLAILVALMISGFALLHYEWSAMKAGELISMTLGALFTILRPTSSNREQQGSTTTLQQVQTVTPTEDTQP